MDLQIREETWSHIDEFFRTIPDAMSKVPTFQEALEEAMQESEERGEQRGVQQSVLRVLQHKFGKLPPPMVQVIEATYDVELLEQWLEQALDANTLTEISFGNS